MVRTSATTRLTIVDVEPDAKARSADSLSEGIWKWNIFRRPQAVESGPGMSLQIATPQTVLPRFKGVWLPQGALYIHTCPNSQAQASGEGGGRFNSKPQFTLLEGNSSKCSIGRDKLVLARLESKFRPINNASRAQGHKVASQIM